METIAAPSRRSLPPVPRPAAEKAEVREVHEARVIDVDVVGLEVEMVESGSAEAGSAEAETAALRAPAAEPGGAVAAEPAGEEDHTVRLPRAGNRRRAADESDPGQRFVASLRAAAPAFARAADAESAVVPEAVPPARHRRCRCRVVLRHADGRQVDVTFVGPAAGRRGHMPTHFAEQILEWLRTGQPLDPAWLTPDVDAAGGHAVDLTAWPVAR